jgi:hypothetical protein
MWKSLHRSSRRNAPIPPEGGLIVVTGPGLVVVTEGFVVVVVGAFVVVGAGTVVVGAFVVVGAGTVVVGAFVVVGAGTVVVGAFVVVGAGTVVTGTVVTVVGTGAPLTAVVWIAGLDPAWVQVCAPRPWTSDEIDEGPDHEMVWPAIPDFRVVLMLISGSDTAFDCTGPVKTTDTVLLSAATVYAPVRLPPEKLTLSSDATWAGAGMTSVIELMVTVIGMLGAPDWTSRVTFPPSTAGSGVSVAVMLTLTAPTIGHVTEIAVVLVSAFAPCWPRTMTRAANAIVATIRTESGFQPTRRDRLLIYFPLLAARCRPCLDYRSAQIAAPAMHAEVRVLNPATR